MRLRVHPNVVDLAEERRVRDERRAVGKPVRFVMCEPPGGVMFVGWQTAPADAPRVGQLAYPPSHGQQLLARLRELKARKPPSFVDSQQQSQQAAPERRWRPKWLSTVLGLAKRSRPS